MKGDRIMKKMSRRISGALIWIVLFSSVLFFSCAKSEKPAGEPSADQPAPAAEQATSVDEEKADHRAGKVGGLQKQEEQKDGDGIQGHFIAPMELAKERLLEYRVDLTYECTDLVKSRMELLGIVSKRGFIKNSSASVETHKAFMTSDLMVKSEKLYDILQELDRVGVLRAETITVTDHTEQMVLQDRKVKREQTRITRKNIAAGQVTAAAKNWNDIENSLERSEDTLDTSEHARWQIRDKVAWAWVHVSLKGPDVPNRIEVPRYSDAFKGLVNVFLWLIYALVYIIPFAILAGLIIWKREKIAGIFRRKK